MTLKRMKSDRTIKVLVVDDSAFYRQTFSGMLRKSRKFEVIGTVADGLEAIRFLSNERPDVITLDLEMPRMDGFTFLRWLMSNNPLPVLVVSSRTAKPDVFMALQLGAVDFLGKPTHRASLEVMKIQDDLLAKVELAATVPIEKLKTLGESLPDVEVRPFDIKRSIPKSQSHVDMIAIGASTGGPPAIEMILARLPGGLSVTIAVAQHMPSVFTKYFAERLNKMSGLHIKEAMSNEKVELNTVYVAPGGHHMSFEKENGVTRIVIEPCVEKDKYIPSVDVLMESAARVFGRHALGVLLTGMGKDGKQGMRRIKEQGGATLAEAEESAVVFGMPREAILEGVVDKVLHLYDIPEEIIRRCL